MLAKLSKRITSFFIKKNSIKEEERDVYEYCFEIMLATLVNLIAIIIIGVSTAKYIETLIFVTLFMALRGSAGGYHANSHLRCFIGIIVVFGIFIGLLYLKIEILKYMSVVFIILAVLSLLFLSPVECKNKEIAKKQSARLRLKLLILNVVFTIIYVALICFDVTVIYAFSVAYTMLAVTILAFAGKLKNKFYK